MAKRRRRGDAQPRAAVSREVMAALDRLRAAGGIEDGFGHLPATRARWRRERIETIAALTEARFGVRDLDWAAAVLAALGLDD